MTVCAHTLSLVLPILIITSCGPLDRVPEFSAAQAFRTSVGADAAATAASGPSTLSYKRVGLPAGLSAEIPDSFGDWRAATDADIGLIVHKRGDLPPDAWVYVDAMGSTATVMPTPPVGLFLYTVDPALIPVDNIGTVTQRLLGGSTGALLDGIGSKSSFAQESIMQMASATLGTGLNYRSDPGAFVAWKYVGKNPGGLMLRGMVTRGRTSPPDDSTLRRVSASAESVGNMSPDAQQALQRLTQPTPPPPGGAAVAQAVGVRRASMLVAVAEKVPGVGAYIAIVCVEEPSCSEAPALLHILDSLKAGADGLVGAPGTDTVADLAATIPVRLMSANLQGQLQNALVPMLRGLIPEPKEPRREGPPQPAKPGPARFFDIPVDQLDDVVFVLDRSGSMMSDGMPGASQLLGLAQANPATSGAASPATSAATGQAGTTAGASGAAPASPQDTSRMGVARQELVAALERLPDGKRFNILYFNEDKEIFSEGLSTMSPEVRGGALAFTADVESMGATAALDALRAAYDQGAKNIIFLSDGMANVGGTPEELLDEARVHMRSGVKFYTVGLGQDVRTDILEALSKESGGVATFR